MHKQTNSALAFTLLASLLICAPGCISDPAQSTAESTAEASRDPASNTVYPASDDMDLSAFTKATAQEQAPRLPANTPLAFPKDYAPGKIFTLIKDPGILQELEARGYTLAYHLERTNKDAVLNSDLIRRSPKYASIIETLTADLNDLTNQEKAARGKDSVGVGIRYPYRVFDAGWFASRIANYQLVGIMNRMDRETFNMNSCGELRFVYRLGYDQGPQGIQSRLPMTMLVKYNIRRLIQPGAKYSTCKPIADKWVYPQLEDPAQFVRWLVSAIGPLTPGFTEPEKLHSIEVNMQAFRIPSSMRPEFGGHGTYLMRVFANNPGNPARMTPAFLENTPDVENIKAHPELLTELKNLMKRPDQLNRIEAGTWLLPTKFLAARAYSYSPMGLSRKENRLFHQLLSEKDFNAADFSLEKGRKFVKTPEAALRRLNDLSCVGCHQGRATAGFHFLGIDRPETHPFNALAFEGSGHFQLDLIRRNRYIEQLRAGVTPDPSRDFSFAPPLGQKSLQGHACGLPGHEAFAHWQCAEGLRCLKIEGIQGEPSDNLLGKCFPEILRAGAPCKVGDVTQTDHDHDKLDNITELSCGDKSSGRHYGCSPIEGGFPSGMCNTRCAGLEASSEICAHIAGSGFTDCVAKGKPFEQCLDGASESGRGLCNDKIACRNDYVCARTREGAGNCTPSYFMFQIRLDGHPNPVM